MAIMVKLKHVQHNPSTGSYTYRRRVPEYAKAYLSQSSEWKRLLGKTEREALSKYDAVHKQFERLLKLAKAGAVGSTPLDDAEAMKAVLKEWGFDPASEGRSPEEVIERDIAADRILDKYKEDIHTGERIGITKEDRDLVVALYQGVKIEAIEPTFLDAFKFYIKEKGKADPVERKQQEQRLERVKLVGLKVMGGDKALSAMTREDARNMRDELLASGMKATSVRRNINTLSAVYRLACIEHEMPVKPIYTNLNIQGADANVVSKKELRVPLTVDTIEYMYSKLSAVKTPELLQVWTLLHHTGARLSEIAGLGVADVKLDDPTPHIVIDHRPWRRLKNNDSVRKVPLVGDALKVARDLCTSVKSGQEHVFPRYAVGRDRDKLSAILMKHLRKHQPDPLQTVHSLRHNMKDALRNAGVVRELQNAILGHELSSGIDADYGVGFGLERMRDALLQVFPDPVL